MTTTEIRASWRPRVPRDVLRATGPWNGEALSMLVLVVVLVVLGLVMSWSASLAEDALRGSAFTTFQRQATWAGLGLGVLLATARVDHRIWRPLAWLLLLLSIAGLVLVLIPGIGLTEGGATRWIAVGPVVLQPSELAKIAALLWLADVAARKHRFVGDGPLPLQHQLVPAVPLFLVLAALVLPQPDLGTTLLLALVIGLVLWFEGVPLRLVLLGGGLLAGATAVAVRLADYRVGRIEGWLDPFGDAGGNGYQLVQSLYAMGSGGVLGVGLGSSRSKWAVLPNPETDFIFAIIGEELGLVGALVVLVLFLAVLVVGMRIARRARDPFGRVVAAGITAWVVGQALLNIATVTGMVPITGITLPLVSVGGSSLLTTLFAFGVLLSIARATDREVAS